MEVLAFEKLIDYLKNGKDLNYSYNYFDTLGNLQNTNVKLSIEDNKIRFNRITGWSEDACYDMSKESEMKFLKERLMDELIFNQIPNMKLKMNLNILSSY